VQTTINFVLKYFGSLLGYIERKLVHQSTVDRRHFVVEQTNLALVELTRTQRYIYSGLLLLALAFELSGNYWLITTAKVAQ